MQPGSKNVLRVPLVKPDKAIMPLLHIKCGLMKNFMKALDKDSDAFWYLCYKFLELSYTLNYVHRSINKEDHCCQP
ncbi:MAG: hypothetical protein ACEY3M_10345, partial [Wolbachia sp.]